MIKANLFQVLRLFRTAGPWLEVRAGLGAIVAGLVLAACLVGVGLAPSYDVTVRTVRIPVLSLITFPGLALSCLAAWFIWRHVYLSTGKTIKLGVAYEAHMIDLDEWQKTRQALAGFFQQAKLRQTISIRFVPTSALEDPDACSRFAARYGFSLLASVEHSVPAKQFEGAGSLLTLKIRGAHAIYRELRDDAAAILKARPSFRSQLDLLKASAKTLHHLILLHVAVLLYYREDYQGAAKLLRYLDASLAEVLPEDKDPRLRIRSFEVVARLHPAKFPSNDPPSVERLDQLYADAVPALDYLTQFPGVGITLARIEFYRGKEKQHLRLPSGPPPSRALPSTTPRSSSTLAFCTLSTPAGGVPQMPSSEC